MWYLACPKHSARPSSQHHHTIRMLSLGVSGPKGCGTAGIYCRIFIGITKPAAAAVPSTDSELAVRAPERVQALIRSRRTHSTGRAQGGEVSWLGGRKKRERDWRMGCTCCCLSNNPNNNITTTFPVPAETKMTHQPRNREMWCFFPLRCMGGWMNPPMHRVGKRCGLYIKSQWSN